MCAELGLIKAHLLLVQNNKLPRAAGPGHPAKLGRPRSRREPCETAPSDEAVLLWPLGPKAAQRPCLLTKPFRRLRKGGAAMGRSPGGPSKPCSTNQGGGIWASRAQPLGPKVGMNNCNY